MPRRGYSTTIGKIAKFHRDRRASEIRMLGEALRREQRSAAGEGAAAHEARHEAREHSTVG